MSNNQGESILAEAIDLLQDATKRQRIRWEVFFQVSKEVTTDFLTAQQNQRQGPYTTDTFLHFASHIHRMRTDTATSAFHRMQSAGGSSQAVSQYLRNKSTHSSRSTQKAMAW
jgi:hypothetical protein